MAGQGSKGGGTVAQPGLVGGNAGPIALFSPQNVSQAGSQGLQGAMAGTNAVLASPISYSSFMNPYTDEVIDRTQADIQRQQTMAQNQLDASASAAGAFGGSRHGVAQGQLAGEYGRLAADTLAGQRAAGFDRSVQNAMADRNSRLAAAGQLGSLAGQAFNTGRAINQDLANNGLLQQGVQQALIDSANRDFANYAAGPVNSLNAPLAALGQANMGQQTTTTTQNPGLLGTLGALKYMNFI